MGAASDEIRVCPNHQDKEPVPLVFTMAFPYKEYWCPGCGYTSGMLGAGDIIKRNKEIDDREGHWKDLGKDYLSAVGARNCESLMFEGERMTYDELPEAEKQRLQKIEDDWKYQFN